MIGITVLPTFIFLSSEEHMLISRKEFTSYGKVATLARSILCEVDWYLCKLKVWLLANLRVHLLNLSISRNTLFPESLNWKPERSSHWLLCILMEGSVNILLSQIFHSIVEMGTPLRVMINHLVSGILEWKLGYNN